ncbi:MAG: hypothetical protein IPG50_02440 [Myxococcales bacterium]|nr:hypothetical protein [Myxococcales bacterium]
MLADPGSVPARGLAIDLHATAGEPTGFAKQLEGLARELPTPEGAQRSLLFAALVWATEARDERRAKVVLTEALSRGAAPRLVHEFARSLAAASGSASWYEEETEKLLALGEDAEGRVQRRLEMVRGRLLASDVATAAKLLVALAGDAGDAADNAGAWIASLLLAFLPTPERAGLALADRAVALDRLARLEARDDVRLGLTLLCARLLHKSGDPDGAELRLDALFNENPSRLLVAVMLAGLQQSAGRLERAAGTLRRAAAETSDGEVAGALELEAGFLLWDAQARDAALVAFDAAAEHVPGVGALTAAWARRGLAAASPSARTRALEDAEGMGERPGLVALERAAVALQARDGAGLGRAVATQVPEGDLAVSLALATLLDASPDADLVARAVAVLAAKGDRARAIASAERYAAVRSEPAKATDAAAAWFSAGGLVSAGLEWVAAAMAQGAIGEEATARRAIGDALGGETREALFASAALLESLAGERAPDAPPLAGASDATHLANLELAPAGSDPRRRALALAGLGATLGEEARLDGLAMAGWSLLASGDAAAAAAAFTQVASARAADLAAWEGLRTAAELQGDMTTRTRAALELGRRCKDASRSAAFLEEAGLLAQERGDATAAESAFAASFAKDPRRAVAFDRLFRRLRDRRDGDQLLLVIGRRLEVCDEPMEISKLFWEQARVLRERGDIDGALKALENVTMIEPEHVGALALTGEIFIKRGEFEQAGDTLARLAGLSDAPAKSRLTAGIAAVDLFENKLDRFDRALEVLIGLHRSGLSTMPVRERLARAAARTGAWNEAIAILEQLMRERPEASGRIEAARLAMAIHRDRLKAPEKAAQPVLQLLAESPNDGEAIDMLLGLALPDQEKRVHLSRARDVLLTALRLNPVDAANADRLVRVAAALGDRELGAVASAVKGALSGSSSARRSSSGVPSVALGDDQFSALLAPGDDGPLATLFAFLAPTLAEALGPTLAALGVTKRDRVDPKSGLALRNEIIAWAGAFGIGALEVYVGGKDPQAVQGVPGEVPALVIGPEVPSPFDSRASARVARELLGLARGTSILRLRDETTVAAIVVATCRLVDVAIEAPHYAVLAEVEKAVGKAIPRKVKKAVHDLCMEIAGSGADAREYRRRALASQARAASVASGDLGFVLSELLEGALEKVQGSLRADERATELLRFALSPTYVELRRALGLEGV